MTDIDHRQELIRRGRERLYPSLRNSSYLVLRRRRLLFTNWIAALSGTGLRVLDVGGRIQPYRPLFGNKVSQYLSVDLLVTPLLDVRGDACALPFPDNCFDVLLCAQMLEYLPEPSLGIAEMRRVLKPGGTLLLSVAAFYPRAVDEEHWRFLRAGVRHLLKDFQTAEIVPEGSSLAGFVRSCEVVFGIFARVTFVRTLLSWTLFPLMNVAGLVLESLAASSNDQAAGNYSVCARK